MRHWFPALILLPVAGFAHADEKRCLISFDSGKLDVCNQQVSVVSEALRPLADPIAHAASPVRIVKFDGPVGRTQREALEQLGAKVLGYAPHHAYLVRMEPSRDAQAMRLPGALWSGPYLPVFKVDVNLANDVGMAGSSKSQTIAAQAGIDQLTVALHPEADLGAAQDALLGVQGLETLQVEDGPDHQRLVMRFQHNHLAQAVHALAAQPEVATVSLRWQHEMLNSEAGWLHQSGINPSLPIFEQGIFGCGQIIGAADSGITATHCSFNDPNFGLPVTSVCASGSGCTPVTPDFGHRKIGAHYKWDGSTTGGPADNASSGHGTHVMGSILGNDIANPVDCQNLTSPGGLTNLDGTAPGARLISQEMGSSLQYLNNLGGTIYHASQTAFANGARIHNNSWGSSCRSGLGTCVAGCQVEYRATTRDADRSVWDQPTLAIFVAAGNSGGLGGTAGCGPGADVGSGGNAKNVFSIGSNQRGTSGDNMSGFSSRGPTQDRRSKPDLTAQGSAILSSARNTTCGTAELGGTSMATPTAAGLAALVREYLQRGFYPSGIEVASDAIAEPSAALLKAIMITGAQEITGSGTTGGAPSQSQGWGRINLDNALYFEGDDRNLWLVDGTTGLQTGGLDEHVITVEQGQPLVVTLTWHDFPALVNANPHGVNFLRLEVETPSGDVWTQKLPAGGGLGNPNPFQDTTTVDYDDRNNVHQIRFDTPVTGSYQIRVRAIQVAEGPQPYALAATGRILGLTEPTFLLQAAQSSRDLCAGDATSFDLGVFSFEGFDDQVVLSTPVQPAGITTAFTVNPVTPAAPAAATVLNISNTGTLTSGQHVIELEGTSSGANFPVQTKGRNLTLVVDEDVPGTGGLLLPADDATDQSLRPAFSWNAFAGAQDYRIEIATDEAFQNVVIDQTVTSTSFTPAQALASNTQHFWRVTAGNRCGPGLASTTFSFTTSELICSEPALAIPDNNATGVSDSISVAVNRPLSDLDVVFEARHTWIGDLVVTLTRNGSGITRALIDRPGVPGSANGCNGDNPNVILDDEAATAAETSCTNAVPGYPIGSRQRPNEALSAFDNASFQGTWVLNVSDRAGSDTGTLDRWCLVPTYFDPSAPPQMADQTFRTVTSAANNTLVGTIVATDPGDTLTFAVTGGTGQSVFSVDASTGQIRVADAAALAEGASFTLAVTVTDTVMGAASATMTLNVVGTMIFTHGFEGL